MDGTAHFMGETLTLTEADGVEVLTIDQPGARFNMVDARLHRELAEVVVALRARVGVTALVIRSAKDDFVVGADIGEFADLFRREEAEIAATNLRLNAGFSALADLPFPVVAAVRGLALGGGLELALCADARVLSETAAVGLPEVKLGLIPGLGGTVRLPRIAGGVVALEWIASGRQVPAAEVLAAGVADRVVPDGSVDGAAIALARELAGDGQWRDRRARRRGPVDARDIASECAQVVAAAPRGQPATAAMSDLLIRMSAATSDAALREEAVTFARIARTQAADALVGAFFAERKVKRSAAQAAGSAPKIASALVLGAGIMGGGIAWCLARSGVTVRIKDIAQASLNNAGEEVKRLVGRDVALGRMDRASADGVLARIFPQLDDEGADRVDLVIEAVVERLEVKRAVLAALEPKLKAGAVIATNTASLRVGDIADALSDPGRLVGMHFFNPVPAMPLVEVICAPQTRAEAVATAVRTTLDLRKMPVVVGDCPGFLVNRILTAYINAFCQLVTAGVDFREIDRAMEDWGWPMGPAWLQDVVGMDTGAHVIEVISAGYPDRMPQGPNVVAEMARLGRLGQKSGQGFYRYVRDERGRSQKQNDPTADAIISHVLGWRMDLPQAEIVARMMVPTLVEAIHALNDGAAASAEELDQALLLGIGFPPHIGGCLRYADWLGAAALVAACDRLEPLVGATCAAPESLRDMAAGGRKFYV